MRLRRDVRETEPNWLAPIHIQVSVGRLGVITKLVMKIQPQVPVRRRRSPLTIWEWIGQLKAIQTGVLKPSQPRCKGGT